MGREVVKRVGRERVAREEQRVEEVDLAERRERLVTRMEVESMIILLGGPDCGQKVGEDDGWMKDTESSLNLPRCRKNYLHFE
eukprot:scaffold80668_cov79-Cyclotella_meneghiniana.AAC.5